MMNYYIELLKKTKNFEEMRDYLGTEIRSTDKQGNYIAPSDEEVALDALYKKTYVVGKTKIDNTKRISLISEIAEMMNAKPGDEIEYHLEGNRIIIWKKTEPFKGYDIDGDIIKENIRKYRLEKEIKNLETEESLMKRENYDKVRAEYEKKRAEEK